MRISKDVFIEKYLFHMKQVLGKDLPDNLYEWDMIQEACTQVMQASREYYADTVKKNVEVLSEKT